MNVKDCRGSLLIICFFCVSGYIDYMVLFVYAMGRNFDPGFPIIRKTLSTEAKVASGGNNGPVFELGSDGLLQSPHVDKQTFFPLTNTKSLSS